MSKVNKQTNQVLYLYAATLLGTLLGVFASIVNTRNLSPTHYGDLRYVQNIINFIATLLLFGYFLSGSRLLALSKNEQNSRRIRGVLVIILGVSVIILILGILLCALLHANKPIISNLFLISIPVCAFPLLNNYVNTVAQGDNHIGRLAIARILPYALYVPSAYFIFSRYGATSSNMMLLQWGIYSFVLLIIVVSTRPTFTGLKQTFINLNTENKNYGIQLYYGSLAMLATNYIAGVTLGAFNQDNVNVGFYTLALTITSPLVMLPGIVGTTYFKQFAVLEKIPPKVMLYTILITTVSCGLFILLIRPLVTFLYDESYASVGVYASWMAIGFCVHGIGDMLNRYLGSHGLGRLIRNSSFICGFIRIIGFTLFVYLWDVIGAIITTVLSSIVYTIVLLLYYKREINLNEI